MWAFYHIWTMECGSANFSICLNLHISDCKGQSIVSRGHFRMHLLRDTCSTHPCFCHLQTMMRIWDTFLYEGSKVLFRYAIAIFKHNEEQLLALDNSISIFNHLRTMCPNALDADRITKVGTIALRLKRLVSRSSGVCQIIQHTQ